jgi:putative chitobiose transport system permease protein
MFTTPLWQPPAALQFKNFADAWALIKIGMRNSMIITVLSTFFAVMIGALSAYPLGRLRFPGRDWIFTVLGLHVHMPACCRFSAFARPVGTARHPAGPDLVHVAHGQRLSFYAGPLLRRHTGGDLTAIIDGASPWTIFWRMLPLTRPALAAVSIIAFTWIWSDYFKPDHRPPNYLPQCGQPGCLTGQYPANTIFAGGDYCHGSQHLVSSHSTAPSSKDDRSAVKG